MRRKGGEKASIVCPRCENEKVWKDGKRKNKNGFRQIHYCKDCGYRFSGALILSDSESLVNRQVCDSGRRTKNLTEAKQKTKASRDIEKNQFFNFTWYLKKEGYAESTIITRTQIIRVLHKRGADLSDPENVKEKIAEQNWTNKRKQNAVNAYSSYLEMQGGSWNPPYYHEVEKPIFIPKESEIDALINGTGLKTSVFIQILKETGARPGEIQNLKWKDIDFEQDIIRITPEKRSKARVIRVSSGLMNRLAYVRKVNQVEDPERVFGVRYKSILRVYLKQRKNVARKLQNDRIMQIKFKTLRHWHATNQYHKTKDILFVQRRLGHKSITNTLKYIHLAETYFGKEDEEYDVKVAENITEAIPLIEAGYVEESDFNGVKIYKIPKSRVVPVS